LKRNKTKELPKQLDFIDKAEQVMMQWAKENNIELYKVDFVVPFVLTDKSLTVWLFFDTDDRVEEYKNNATIERVKNQFIKCLKDLYYPPDYLTQVDFVVDSDENVKTNFEGNYLYRLR
jgi:hypothetical protein